MARGGHTASAGETSILNNATTDGHRGEQLVGRRWLAGISRNRMTDVPPLAAGMPTSPNGLLAAERSFDADDEADSCMTAPLDSRQLRAFASLARTGSFTRTARELHLSQSAISHSMKALESDVGCRLLDRLSKTVTLTQAGEQLLQHAEKILSEMAAARAALEQLGKWGQGRLRLGASDTACQHILPGVLREFKERFPHCALMIEPGDTPDLIESLIEGRLDLALGMKPEHETRLDFHPLFTDELMFLVSATHPWALARRAAREDIPRQKYILYSKQSLTFRFIERYFRAEGIVLNTVLELGNMEAICELVKLGLGVSIVAPWIARDDLQKQLTLALPLGRHKLRRHWGILHLRGRRLNLAEETFINLCRAATRALPLTEPAQAVRRQ